MCQDELEGSGRRKELGFGVLLSCALELDISRGYEMGSDEGRKKGCGRDGERKEIGVALLREREMGRKARPDFMRVSKHAKGRRENKVWSVSRQQLLWMGRTMGGEVHPKKGCGDSLTFCFLVWR